MRSRKGLIVDLKAGLNPRRRVVRHRRPYIGVVFKCCNVYSRIYLSKNKTSFVGWCPKCGGKMVVEISPHGSKSKFFVAD
ncbi:MAG: hypothetical protein J7K40_08905 [candidate division Zixibacteria bacterium]|nr:hypothetical protein [candidate division Zixibacteria bacterium]